MIFKQIDEIIAGRKTQTRRIVKENEIGFREGYADPNFVAVHTRMMPMPPKYAPVDRLKWATGRSYAVVPKRGQPAIWLSRKDGAIVRSDDAYEDLTYMQEYQRDFPDDWRGTMRGDFWWQLRIQITAIRRERLQDISEEDAKAEGVDSVDAYRALWDSINTRKGVRWSDNPPVWVLEFKVVKV